MEGYSEAFVAFDVAKKKHAVALAEGGRTGEVRFVGEVENSPATLERTIKKLGKRYDRLHVCFEAGPTGYGLYRQVRELGHDCMVVAPALIPKRHGRANQDEPTGCGHAGAAAPSGRADRSVGAGRRPRGLSAIWCGPEKPQPKTAPQTPGATLLPSAPWADLRGRLSLDIGAPALACLPELRAYGAADRVPGEDRRDRGRGSAVTSPGRAAESHRAAFLWAIGREVAPS